MKPLCWMPAAPVRVGTCQRSFTFGRRYPKVIGRIGRFTLPAPMSVLQLGVFVGGVGVLRAVQPVWAHLGGLNIAVYLVVPAGLAFAARFARVEGRSPARFLLGMAGLALASRGGYLRGRAVPAARPWQLSGAVFTDPGPSPAAAPGSSRPATESCRPATQRVAAQPSVADLQAALARARSGRGRGRALAVGRRPGPEVRRWISRAVRSNHTGCRAGWSVAAGRCGPCTGSTR